MKRFRSFMQVCICMFCTLSMVWAQTPQGINYQTVLRDGNSLVTSGTIQVKLKVLQNGNPVYEETHTVQANPYGLINVELGSETPTLGQFDLIDWSTGNHELDVTIIRNGVTTPMGSTKLVSVPYSLYAERASTVDNLTLTGGPGILISGTTITNTGDTDATDDLTVGSAASGDLSGSYPNPTVSQLNGFPVNISSPAAGQVLEWNGAAWAPATDDNTAVAAGTGIAINGNVINNTGDTDPSDDITTSTSASGDLSGTYPNPTVSQLNGFPLNISSPSPGQVLEWNGSAWTPATDDNTSVSAGSGISISGNVISNTGDLNPNDDITVGTAASGDLSGSYPNPTVTQLDGFPLNINSPSPGQVLEWNGAAWTAATDDNTTVSAGSGISINGNVVSNTGDLNPNDDITIGTAASGDLSGSFPNPIVSKLNGMPISIGSPLQGQVLKWDGSQWSFSTDLAGTNLWTQSGSNVFYNAGNVGIGITPSLHALHVGGSNQTLRLTGLNGSFLHGGRLNFGDADYVYLDEALDDDLRIHAFDIELDGFTVGNFDIQTLDDMVVDDDIFIYDDMFAYDFMFGYHNGVNVWQQGWSIGGGGYMQTDGPNGNLNIQLSALLNFNNNGYVAALDQNGAIQAGMYVNSANQGVVFADIKNFRIPHPDKPGKDIWYASVEGPEAAAYVRGTTQLSGGEATVVFPDHFQAVANAGSMTVSLTPLSADSEGLAVIEKTNTGFKVKELHQGQGNYGFDWEVKCVRLGYENYEVVRDSHSDLPATASQTEVTPDPSEGPKPKGKSRE